nr:unnamed protein product [Callosobruchus analis]
MSKIETRVCEIHVNFHFLISKLKFYIIIKESSSSEITEGITCSAEGTVKGACFKKRMHRNHSEHVKHEKWVSKKDRVLIKGQEKICVKKVKETLYCNKGGLVQEFKSGLPIFYVSSFQYDSPVPNN